MITPLGKNVLLKRKEKKSSIIYVPEEKNDLYLVLNQGSDVLISLINKTVYVKEGLHILEIDDNEYYIVNYENILAVVEE